LTAKAGWLLLGTLALFWLARRFFQRLSPHFEDMV